MVSDIERTGFYYGALGMYMQLRLPPDHMTPLDTA
jgi:hypothetical protein